MIEKEVGANIKRLRTAAGISQKELGRMIGKSESYISDAENGRNEVSIVCIEKIAEALKIPTLSLVDSSYGVDTSQREFEGFSNLRIYKVEDRLAVATILLKNGYTVSQRKQNRTQTGKVVDYFLSVKLSDENADTSR